MDDSVSDLKRGHNIMRIMPVTIIILPLDRYSIQFGMTEPITYKFERFTWEYIIKHIREDDKVIIHVE